MRTAAGRLAITGLIVAATSLGLAAPAPAQLQAIPVPGVAPPGANDFSCVPREGRAPVILVHGTFLDMTTSWRTLAPQLVGDGFCVFALDYGQRGTAPVDASADELAAFTRRVLDATGAPQVSFVGHSQGGLLARWTVRSRGLLDRTRDIVGLAPSHHGTTQPLASLVTQLGCRSCADQTAGSAFLDRANAAPEAPEEVDHTVVTTIYDEVVTPPASQALDGPTVGNVVLQDQCPSDTAEHVAIVQDPVALAWVRHALLRDGPADPAARADCSGASLPQEAEPTATGATPSPAATPAPEPEHVRLVLLSGVLRITRAATVPVRVRCDGPEGARCVSLVRLRRGSRILGTVRASIPVGPEQTVRMRIARSARAKLRADGTGVRVALRATTADGVPRATARGATLRRG